MKEARVHNYRKGCGNVGDTVARATMGCDNVSDTVARATMGCGNAGRHSAEALSYMERSLCQTTGGQMGRPDIEQFSNYYPAKGR